MVACLTAWKVTNPQILIMDGDPTDNNATLFAQGYNGVLDAALHDKLYPKVGEPAGTWDPPTARPPSSSSSPPTPTSTRW